MANLYAAITGDTESAKKIEEFTTSLFETPEQKEAENREAAGSYSALYGLDSHQTVMGYASSMFASPMEYGISESQADEWITALSKGASSENYAQVAAAVVDAWNSVHNPEFQDDKGGGRRFNEHEEDDEAEVNSTLAETTAALQTVSQSLSTLKADVTAAAKEGCMAGVGSITVTGSVSTGNVMLNTGSLVGSLAPKLNLKLGVLNAMR